MYVHIKNEISSSRLSEVRAQAGQTHTDTQRDAIKHITTLQTCLPPAFVSS